MRISISNIAWDIHEDADIADLLKKHQIDAIDLAPGKYFPDPQKAKDAEIIAVKQWWADRGIEIFGMQALLFGTTGLNVFGSTQSQAALLHHLSAICTIGANLGARRLVFGSPKNRDRSGLSDTDARKVAIEFFSKLGDIAAAAGVLICLEPNPTCYGANFMVSSVETAQVVQSVAHPAIRMQLDAGAMTINSENIAAVVANFAPLVAHVHASEPDLMPLGERGTRHDIFSLALQQHLPQAVVCIETLASRGEPHLSAISRSLATAIKHYRNMPAGATP